MPLNLDNIPAVSTDINISRAVDGIFVGFVLSTILLGVTILQAWHYTQNNHDTWKLRSFVALLVALDVAITISSSIFIHDKLVEHFGNTIQFFTIDNGLLAELTFTGVVVFLVQLFFASRVHLLNPGNYWLAAIIVFTSFLGFVAIIYTIIVEVTYRNLSDLYLPMIRISAGVHQGLIIVADAIVTIVLSTHFIKARSTRLGKQTQNTLQNLLTFILARGLLITVSDMIFFVLYCANPGNLDWMPIQLNLSKLYVITMLALLNGRHARYGYAASRVDTVTMPIRFAGSRFGSTIDATPGLRYALSDKDIGVSSLSEATDAHTHNEDNDNESYQFTVV